MKRKLIPVFLLLIISVYSEKAECIFPFYSGIALSGFQNYNSYRNDFSGTGAAILKTDDTLLTTTSRNNSKVDFPFTIKITEAPETYFSQQSPLFSSTYNGELTTATPDNLNLMDLITERGFVVPENMTISGVTAWVMCLTPGLSPTISLSIYVYSPASGTFQNSPVTGELRGSQSIRMGTVDSVNSIASFHINGSAIPLHQGQVVILWANSTIGCNCVINGTLLMESTEQ